MNKIAIRVDGNKVIGNGHIGRCLVIAEHFRSRNFDVCFIVSSDTDTSLLADQYRTFVLNHTTYDRWDEQDLATVVRNNSFDYLLVDSYFVNGKTIDNIDSEIPVFYLDDNYIVRFKCDGIINYNVESSLDRYEKRDGVRYYLGTKYFPLNTKFRVTKLTKANRKTVLITSGSTDRDHICLEYAVMLAASFPNVGFVILIGNYFDDDYVSTIQNVCASHANIRFLKWGDDYYNSLSSFTLVIGPGSTILYEALCLSVPCISYEFVENHHLECVTLDSLDVVPFVGKYAKTPGFLDRMLSIFTKEIDDQTIAKRRHKNSLFMDSHGVERVFDAITHKYENDN